LVEGIDQDVEQAPTLLRAGLRGGADDTGGAVALHAKEVQIGTVGSLPIILGPALPHEVRCHVKKDGGLSLPGVHVVMGAGDTPGDGSGGLPIG